MDSTDLIEGGGVGVPTPSGSRSVRPAPARSRPAVMAAAGTVVLWASAFPAIAGAVPALGPVGLSGGRLGGGPVPRARAAPFLRVRRPQVRDLPLIMACGLAGMAGYQLLLNQGERIAPPGHANPLVAPAPIYPHPP